MSHKNFNQRDLADCMLTDHKALHELDDVMCSSCHNLKCARGIMYQMQKHDKHPQVVYT